MIERSQAAQHYVVGEGLQPREDDIRERVEAVLRKPATRRAALALVVGAAAWYINERVNQPSPLKDFVSLPFPRQRDLIISGPLFSDLRTREEESYASHATTLEQVDTGFQVLSRRKYREELLDKRAALRAEGALPQLSQRQQDWARLHKIHPEVLAACSDAYPVAAQVIQKLKGGLRGDFVTEDDKKRLQQIPAEQFMINIGGMAELVCQETSYGLGANGTRYGFCYIGDGKAWDQINDKNFPDDKNALMTLSRLLQQDTGLSYTARNIQGSVAGSGDQSGGAIGLQFMPSKALELYQLLGMAGQKFNPFDLESSLVGAWVFLAREQVFSFDDPNNRRFGYYRGKPDNIRKAIEKWNPKKSEVDAVYTTAVDYYNLFTQ